MRGEAATGVMAPATPGVSLRSELQSRLSQRLKQMQADLAEEVDHVLASGNWEISHAGVMAPNELSVPWTVPCDQCDASTRGGRRLSEANGHFELWPTFAAKPMSVADTLACSTADKIQGALIMTQTNRAIEGESSAKKTCLIINPSKPFYMCWSVAFTAVLCCELTLLPLGFFPIPDSLVMNVFLFFSPCFWTLDFALSWVTGYYSKKGELVMDIRVIAWQYWTTWMVPDLVVLFVDWFSLIVPDESQAVRAGKLFRYLRLLRVFRVIRLRKMQEFARMLDDHVSTESFSILKSIVTNMLGMIAICHVIGCVWYRIGTVEVDGYPTWVALLGYEGEENWFYLYLTSLHWALTQFTPGSMNVQPENVYERAWAILVLIFGMIVFSSIVSSLTSATNSLKSMNFWYYKQIWLLRKYFREQAISTELCSRVTRYADCSILPKLNRVRRDDLAILGMLPKSLYLDVLLEHYTHHLQGHPFFFILTEKCRSAMQQLVCKALGEVVLSAGDELFATGMAAYSMYFVAKGLLIYITGRDSGPEHIGPRDWICEAALWTQWVHQGHAVAEMESEVIAVDSAKFREVLAERRTDMWLPQRYGSEFVTRMNKEVESADVDLTDSFHVPPEVATGLRDRSSSMLSSCESMQEL